MTSYELPANAREGLLRLNIEEAKDNLQELNISNCIVANPDDLLWYISGMQTLQTLRSVACPLNASFLLDSLLRSLETVIHLEFSLVDNKEDAEEQLIKIRHIEHMANEHRNRETKLRKVFVEVAGEENMQVLSAFLMYCPHVTDLHIHMLHIARADVDVATCMRIVEGMHSLEVFTLTCEALLPTQPEPNRPLDLQYCAGIHGNVVFRKRQNGLNYALLRDLSRSSIAVLPGEPTVMVAFDTPDLEGRLHDAGSWHDWSDLRSLCIVLFSQRPDDTVYPAVGAAYDGVLRDFFGRFSSLSELNVSSFHFGDGIDFTELLSTPALQRLRAAGAVRRLAISISDIEDLDIRLNVGGRHQSCHSCNQQLVIETADTSVFSVSTGQGRLTFCNVPNLASLSFLGSCQVPHLRFIDIDDNPCFDYNSLAKAICTNLNDSLRSLVVKIGSLNFLHPSFTVRVPCAARYFWSACAYCPTRGCSRRFAESVIKSLAVKLGSISYLHMHYVDEAGREARLTWIRLLDGIAGQSHRGEVMAGKPCIMCSTQTFIALAKPRRREL
ncbi:hypothetical protein HPB49_019128 [Dermacentor silvarum]|uniref:Uncharacterized protein n=1 Tax=Dermacentor silvarum TaxID=543639 RepID=A0ACB8DKE5_DERSI|nr:hypothetical protein HPB49_019128 [Dermacentor silvarum]